MSTARRVTVPLTDDRGDLSAYLAQGVLALASTTSLYRCQEPVGRTLRTALDDAPTTERRR